MNFVAEIDIMPHKELLDPQGKTVVSNMKNLNITNISDVRIGKHIRMILEANSKEEASQKVETACKKLLVNAIMEGYVFTLEKA